MNRCYIGYDHEETPPPNEDQRKEKQRALGCRRVSFPEPIKTAFVNYHCTCDNDGCTFYDDEAEYQCPRPRVVMFTLRVTGYLTDLLPEEVPSYKNMKDMFRTPSIVDSYAGHGAYTPQEFFEGAKANLFERCVEAYLNGSDVTNPSLDDFKKIEGEDDHPYFMRKRNEDDMMFFAEITEIITGVHVLPYAVVGKAPTAKRQKLSGFEVD